MPSRRDRVVALAVVAGFAACGNTPQAVDDVATPDGGYMQMPCDQSFLTYDNFGRPFMENWCTGCHSSSIPGDANLCAQAMADMRQCAPPDVNFDTQADVVSFQSRIAARAAGDVSMLANPMPPQGGPAQIDRDMLAEWLGCGVK